MHACVICSPTPPPPNLGSLIQYLPVISAGDIFLMCNLHLPCYEFTMDAEEGHTQLHLGGLFNFFFEGSESPDGFLQNYFFTRSG